MSRTNIKSLIAKLNTFCRTGLESSAGICVSRSHYEITVEHVIWQMTESPMSDFSLLLKYLEISHESIKAVLSRILEELPSGNTAKPVFSPRLMDWYEEAQLQGTLELGEDNIRSGALFLGLIQKAPQLTSGELLELVDDLKAEDLVNGFAEITKNSIENEVISKKAWEHIASTSSSALSKYCEDFTKKAEEGKIDPVFGRDGEIRQVIDIFARRRKNNPIVVGEAGVGKTAIVEGLALRIVEGDVPDFLKNVSILGLDMGLLQAGAGVKGEFENRLKNVIEEVKASEKPVILFIDEAHTMIGAGGNQGGSDAANLLKPALARGELRTIAATTWSEYKKYFEKDAALARRFQLVHLEEPSVDTATLILRGLKSKYEKSHGVIILDDAIKAASEMAGRYISGRYLPDKAIDLLDTSCARVKVLLTSKPDAVENIERKLQALEREKKAISRDEIYGVEVDEEEKNIVKEKISSLEKDLVKINERWEKEKELSANLIELRKEYFDSVSEKNTEEEVSKEIEKIISENPSEEDKTEELQPPRDYQQEIDEIIEELSKVQGDEPLIQTEVNPEIVSKVVSDWTGIPAGKVMNDEAAAIIALEDNLKKRIKGQDKAIKDLTRIIKSSKAGLKNPEQPLGVFLLTGPSGVGKTETGLAIADLIFGGERSTVSINMSEFQEKHTVSRLIGSPPGYVGYGEGGVLTEAVRQRPYSVVLLDEVEKANTEVMNLFYQVFDKGVLSDGEGRDINFKNTIILLTSNLASELITESVTRSKDIDNEELKSLIRPELSSHFKPALLARMSIIPFSPLDSEIMGEIVKAKLDLIAERLFTTHKVSLCYSEEVIVQIALRCLEVETGARNIDHIMEGTLLPLISQELLTRMGQGDLPPEIEIEINEQGLFSLKVDEKIY